MASTTPIYGLSVPDLTDAPNGPSQITELANDVETVLNTAGIRDTGVLTTGITITPGTGFTITYTQQKRNGVLFLKLLATRTGSNITAPSSGNLGNTLVATLPSGWRPAVRQAVAYVATTTTGGCLLNTDGTWQIIDAHPTSVISTGDNLQANFVYPL